MQTPFHTSGFLYSLKSHKILLLQSDTAWTMLGGDSFDGEKAEAAFARIVNNILKVSLKTKNIFPIYDYFHDGWNKTNYVFYGEVKNPQKFNCLKENSYCWVAFNEISKLLFTSSTKQDVIVGERVINAKWRENEANKLATVLNSGIPS